MLYITIPSREFFDEKNNVFIEVKGQTIQLEHSLVSISKWESRWKKPYLSPNNNKTNEEFIDYIKCMTITQNVNPSLYFGLTEDNITDIAKYIEDPMSARLIVDLGGRKTNREVITSEYIYYYMFSFNIPLECQKWHLNRLLNLINLFSIKNQPKKKGRITRAEMIERDRLNKERKEKWNTKG